MGLRYLRPNTQTNTALAAAQTLKPEEGCERARGFLFGDVLTVVIYADGQTHLE